MSGFEVIEEGPPPSPRLQEANNSSGLNRVKMRRLETTTTDKLLLHVISASPKGGGQYQIAQRSFLKVYFRVNRNF